MDRSVYEHYINLGLSVVGCNDDKTAVISWSIFQNQIASSSNVDLFVKKASKIAVICGEVSGNLICLDFDIKNHANPEQLWQEVWEKIIDYFDGDPSNLTLVKTPSGGYHLWFKTENVSTNKKIAGRPTTDEEKKINPKLKKVYFIETRGQGGYAVVPPSAGYQFLIGSFEKIPFLTDDSFEDILSICRSYNTIEDEAIELAPKNVPVHIYKDTPWDAYNEDPSHPILEVLQTAGWTPVTKAGSLTHFRRPGSDNKWSANYCEDKKLFYVFTINSDFDADQAYTPFTVLKTLNFAGDKKETIKYLRTNGYGKVWEDHESDLIVNVALELDKGKMFQDIINSFHQLKDKPEPEQIKIINAALSTNRIKKGAFWIKSKRGALLLDRNSLLSFLKESSVELQKNWKLMLLVDDVKSTAFRTCIANDDTKIIKQVTLKNIKDVIFSWIDNFDFSTYDVTPHEVKNLILNITDAAWATIMDFIPVTNINDLNFLRDEKDISYHFFINNVVTITKESITCRPYDYFQSNVWIWEDKIIQHNYNELAITEDRIWNSYLCSFFKRLSGMPKDYDGLSMMEIGLKDSKRLDSFFSFVTIFGYLGTNYKDPACPYAILIAEDTADDGDGGGTGKGLFMKCVSQIRNTCIIDGKNWQPDRSFAWQRVDLNTDIISIEDVEKYFNFRRIYNTTTEGIEIEKKNKDSFFLDYKHSPKITISTNYEGVDSSIHYLRRIKKLLLSRYFNLERTPRSEYNNKSFFSDWNEQEWNEFYTFSFECIQAYFNQGIQVSEETDNSIVKAIKLKAGAYGDDFYMYCEEKIENNLSYEFNYVKKDLWRDFINENELSQRDLSMKHFTEAIKFYCHKKGYTVQEKRDENYDPLLGSRGVVKLFFERGQSVTKTEESVPGTDKSVPKFNEIVPKDFQTELPF